MRGADLSKRIIPDTGLVAGHDRSGDLICFDATRNCHSCPNRLQQIAGEDAARPNRLAADPPCT